MRMTTFVLALAALTVVVASPERAMAAGSDSDLRGAWLSETYVLADGTRLPLSGVIIFAEADWATVYFTLDPGDAKTPRRGGGSAGTYTLEDGQLEFVHVYSLSYGEQVASLPPRPVRMEIRDPPSREPCRIEIAGDRLTIHFGPSGNAQIFRRSPRP